MTVKKYVVINNKEIANLGLPELPQFAEAHQKDGAGVSREKNTKRLAAEASARNGPQIDEEHYDTQPFDEVEWQMR